MAATAGIGALYAVSLLVFLVELVLSRRAPDAASEWQAYTYWFPALTLEIGAIHRILHGQAVGAVIDTMLAGYFAWVWWTNFQKRRRRKKRTKVFAKVVDFGHRLGVVPAGS